MALILRPPTSRESLTEDLAHLGRTRKRVAVATGILQFVGLVLGCVAFFAILDIVFHLPPLARAAALAITLTLGGIVWLRQVARPLSWPTSALSVALELEEKYPILNDALASAVSFLDSPSPEERGVSNRLQSAAVRSARRLAERYEFRRMIPTGACWRAAWACALIVAVIVPLVLVGAERAAIALTRLADPFGAHPFPTKTRIEVLTPEQFPVRMPKGEPFDLRFAVRGVVPDRATVTFRLTGGDEFEENYPLATESTSAAMVSAKIDPNRLPGPFSFRIISNDADTGWLMVDVVPPPRLVPLNGRASPQFHVIPPDYTGLAPRELPEGAMDLQLPTGPIPVGTLVSIKGATDLRLSAASLVYLGNKSAVERAAPFAGIGHLNPIAAVGAVSLASSIGNDVPLALDASGRVFSASFQPSMPGPYALKITDETGLTGSRTIEIPLAIDPPPAVTLLRPAPGQDATVLTLHSSVPVQIVAKDAVGEVPLYAVRRAFLEYRVGREGTIWTIELADARAGAVALSALTGLAPVARIRPVMMESHAIVPVAAFRRDDGSPVREGDTIYLRGAADDWDDVSPAKEPGRSEGEVEIVIASAESIEGWLQRELAAMRPDLLRLRDQQRDARNRTLDVAPQPDGSIVPADRDRLLGVQHLQDQIGGKIADPRDGLAARAEALRATLRANNLPRSNVTDRVIRVADELARIKERDLPAIKPSLSSARELGALPPRTGQEGVVPDFLKKAERYQREVEDGLTNLLDLLAVWGGAGEIRGEARALRDLLNRLANDTDRFAERIPSGRSPQELRTDQRTELDRAGTRAEQIAEQTGTLLARAGKLAEQKERASMTLNGLSAATDIAAGAAAAAANALPPGEPRKSAANADAAALRAAAEDLRGLAAVDQEEAAALRKGVSDAEGETLPNELRKAASALRDNRQGEGANLQRSGADRLDRLANALAEKSRDEAPDLKKWRKAANELDALAAAQDDLGKRGAAAARISDPAKRAAELKRLAAEQNKLLERGRELLQRLTREGADGPAFDTRHALDQMETARDQLEQGNSATRAQNDATDRLDSARDRLDRATADPAEKLSDEKRRKMADAIKGLLERQKAAVAEAERIHRLVVQDKSWRRPVETSYVELARSETNLADEVVKLEADFAPLPVLARVLAEAAGGMKKGSDAITSRIQDIDPALAFDAELEAANDRKVLRPMSLAARRLDQLLEALKTEDPKAKPKRENGDKAPNAPPAGGGSGGGGGQDIVPPLAQLKVLRALQAELNQQTAEFAKAHPDTSKLTDDERGELKDLEQAQREIAALFEQMTQLFDQSKGPKPGKSEPEKKP